MPRWLALLLPTVLINAVQAYQQGDEFCSTFTTCLKNGGADCDVTTHECPPCIYTLADRYTCWEKDNITNTCPFTGVKYDCSTAWSTSTTTSSTASSTTTDTTSTTTGSLTATGSVASSSGSVADSSPSASTTESASSSSSSSDMLIYGGIGVGAFIIFILLLIVCRRRKRRNEPQSHSPGIKLSRHPKLDDIQTHTYTSTLDTSKQSYGYQRKRSTPAMMEAGHASDDRSFMSMAPTEDNLSVDGMLGEEPQTPVMLGNPKATRKSMGLNRKSSGRSLHRKSSASKSVGKGERPPPTTGPGFTSVSTMLQQDVSIRCTASANVFGEYLRMKEEMQFDRDDDVMSEMSDMSELESDTMSLSKFSLESSNFNMSRIDNGYSITDSEFSEDMRQRGESDCFSEMSYNDEKYSFSEDLEDVPQLDMTGRKPNREVEI